MKPKTKSRPVKARPHVRLAADIGGTFTDIAVFDDRSGALTFGKTLSTPQRLVDGINAGVEKAGSDYRSAGLFLHGSTIAINTVLERTGAKTALLITEGFRDVYEIGRINRPDAYNLFFRKHVPLVERALRFEVKERVFSDGEIETPLDESEIAALGETLEKLGIEACAILFLNCYARADHEARAKAILETNHPQMFVSASHELSQEYREFERCSTVVANAYVGPKVRRYVGEIDQHIRSAGFDGSFLIVQSTGGLYDVEQAQSQCVRMLESGPAAGVIGTQALCRTLGIDNAIAFDMGGTTAKAGVIYNGEALTTGSALIGGYDQALPVQIAMMDIFEVGTGGGSIARLEEGGLRVGPQSAGAAPGPACYGLGGTEPTVTDANLVLGRLAADRFLGVRCGSTSRRRSALSRMSASRSVWTSRRLPMASCASRRPPCHTQSKASPPNEASTPVVSRSWPMAEPVRCTPCRWRARSASAPSSSRPRPVCSRHSVCCSRTCATISCAPG
jgi:N-methylhydantoinase A